MIEMRIYRKDSSQWNQGVFIESVILKGTAEMMIACHKHHLKVQKKYLQPSTRKVLYFPIHSHFLNG